MLAISPSYQMKLVKSIDEAIWTEYKSYDTVKCFIEKWQVWYDDFNANFYIVPKGSTENIDLTKTLHNIDGETLLKIAIDLGVETPDFIPSIPTFRNEIKSDYQTTSATFEKAFKDIETNPDTAIGLANSALESIIKEILKDSRIKTTPNKGDTLYKLATAILSEFKLFPNAKMPEEIKAIGSSLLAASQGIEKIRSEKTNFHGKTSEDYIVNDSLYTYFIVNSVCTLGLFLISFYKTKFPKVEIQDIDISEFDDLPF